MPTKIGLNRTTATGFSNAQTREVVGRVHKSKQVSQALSEFDAITRIIETAEYSDRAFALDRPKTCRENTDHGPCGFALRKSEEGMGRCSIHVDFGALTALDLGPEELHYKAMVITQVLMPRLAELKTKGPQ
ncbi:MAG TPA: hypothetical protein VIN59_07330 [Alphaproteobacteria bacterium]